MATSAVSRYLDAEHSGVVADDISSYAYKSWNELFGLSREELESFQLSSARRRFEELAPQVAALKDQADKNKVKRIDTLNDLAPLLFNHTTYKSYPLSLLENNRFDMLTRWLQRVTTVDLSGVDVSKCEGIDDWLSTLEANTALQMFHTTGTTGKLSFIPRTTLERDLFNYTFLKLFTDGFGADPAIKLGGTDGARLPVIYPSARHGRYTAQRLIKYLGDKVAPAPDQVYTISNGTLSADLISLAGRIRVAQAKGEVSRMKLTDSQRFALKRYIEEQANRAQEMSDFFARIVDRLQGKRVFLFSQAAYLTPAAQGGLEKGMSGVFAKDSVMLCGGGGKDGVLPADWLNLVHKFTGIAKNYTTFAMTEATGWMQHCAAEGHYHVLPWFIAFLLDPETGAPLPRTGTQTGRLALMDLLAQHYWGGIISGDKITIEWDRPCSCGRKGPYLHDDISRYATNVTGDDKINCSATVDNTDAALQSLLAGK